MAANQLTEHTTALALHEKTKLIKSLRRFDMVFFTVCAFVGLDTLGTVASNGPQGSSGSSCSPSSSCSRTCCSWPRSAAAFTQEGGPYEWMKLAWGRLAGGIGAILYWVTNPLWVGGSLAFIATDAGARTSSSIGHGTFGDYLFKLIFIWISIGVAIVSLQHGKWIPNFGALLRIIVIGFFSLTVDRLRRSSTASTASRRGSLSPTRAVFLGARAGAALQLRRLRAPERRRGGDGEPAARRSDLGLAQAASSACSCT